MVARTLRLKDVTGRPTEKAYNVLFAYEEHINMKVFL